jgi:ubiquinone biosynthesis protein
MLRFLRTLLRLVAIARTLARHDALAPLEDARLLPGFLFRLRVLSPKDAPGRPGEKLARALTELGPSFIKFGQVLSTRADLLGEEAANDLSQLQDRLPPFPGAAAREIIEKELDRPLLEVFQDFTEDALSAASIAQVHLAVTTEGHPVAVKVLRPGIEQAFERDLELFYWVAKLAERTQPRARRLKPVEVVGLFEETVRIEMDLRMEAAAASELAENFHDDPSYSVPAIDWERTSRRVLTMDRIEGIPLDDRAALVAAGQDLEAVLQKAATIFFKQVFRDGFFHGDQHPGNMFVDADGNILAVDFGIMGRMDKKTRCFLADMLMSTLARDYRRLAEVHVEAGYLPRGPAVETFAQALRSVCEPIAGRALQDISFARLLAQLLQLTEAFNMPVQPQLLLLQKNMLIAEGVSRSLEPSLNIWTMAQPLIEDWMREHRGPEARLRDTASDWADHLQRLPETLANLERAADQLSGGGLKLHAETLAAFTAGRDRSRLQIRIIWIAVALLGILFALN